MRGPWRANARKIIDHFPYANLTCEGLIVEGHVLSKSRANASHAAHPPHFAAVHIAAYNVSSSLLGLYELDAPFDSFSRDLQCC